MIPRKILQEKSKFLKIA